MKAKPYPPPGFRFSPEDAGVLVIGVVATAVWWKFQPALAPALPIVLGHFFLFCNVFRISRQSELIWAGVFLGNAIFWAVRSEGFVVNWLAVLLTQTPVTLVLILFEMFRPGYHGVGASLFNKPNS